jgi:hypothetical protein
MSAAAIAFPVRCHYCSHFRPAWRVHQLSGAAQTICDYCFEWHNKAIEFLAGRAMPGCQKCGATWEFLRDSTPGVEVRMYVVPRDGIYQLLCAGCIRPYVEKRADLYRGTAFGADSLKI